MNKRNILSIVAKMANSELNPSLEFIGKGLNLSISEEKTLNELAQKEDIRQYDTLVLNRVSLKEVEFVVCKTISDCRNFLVEVDFKIDGLENLAVKVVAHELSPLEFNKCIGSMLGEDGFITPDVIERYNHFLSSFDTFWRIAGVDEKNNLIELAMKYLEEGVSYE